MWLLLLRSENNYWDAGKITDPCWRLHFQRLSKGPKIDQKIEPRLFFLKEAVCSCISTFVIEKLMVSRQTEGQTDRVSYRGASLPKKEITFFICKAVKWSTGAKNYLIIWYFTYKNNILYPMCYGINAREMGNNHLPFQCTHKQYFVFSDTSTLVFSYSGSYLSHLDY